MTTDRPSDGIVAAWAKQGWFHEFDERAVFVADLGPDDDREPVLLLHGFPTSGADWHSVAAALARSGRRVVVPDFLGFGFSAKPDQEYSLFEQADLVESVLADLGITHVALVTHDMGDSIGGEILARSLDGDLDVTVKRRVLTNGSIYLDLAQLSAGQQLLLSLPDAALTEAEAELVGADGLRGALVGTFAPGSAVPDAEVDAMVELVLRSGGNRLLPRTIRYIEERREHEDRWTGAIETHSSPLQVIWGDADPIAVVGMTDRLVEHRPGTPVTRLEAVGHYPMLEAPTPFLEALQRGLTA
ncbi:MAG: Epoxide hydrolase [Actinomycetia bacterium]|nr:Epoxide hydrolase [Actinomycetes bacterium]